MNPLAKNNYKLWIKTKTLPRSLKILQGQASFRGEIKPGASDKHRMASL